MAAPPFHHRHRVTYSECTLGNHVYYARYLDFLEEARGEFFRALGLPLLALQGQDTLFPVVTITLDYHAPARYDEVLDIELRLVELTRTRVGFECRILNEARRILVQGRTGHVCTSLAEKPKRIPELLVERLTPCLQTAGA